MKLKHPDVAYELGSGATTTAFKITGELLELGKKAFPEFEEPVLCITKDKYKVNVITAITGLRPLVINIDGVPKNSTAYIMPKLKIAGLTYKSIRSHRSAAAVGRLTTPLNGDYLLEKLENLMESNDWLWYIIYRDTKKSVEVYPKDCKVLLDIHIKQFVILGDEVYFIDPLLPTQFKGGT